MKYHFFTLGLIAVLLSACTVREEDHSAPVLDDGEEFYASIEGADTRVFVDDLLRVRWNADDRVSIFNRTTYNRQYRFAGQDGDNSGTFKKVPTDDFVTSNPIEYVYSVYPYKEETRISDDGELTVYLPAEQSYREETFGLGANTMIAVADDNELMFKNLCGYIMLKLYGDNVAVTSISLKGNNNEPLAGKATVVAAIGADPTLSPDASATGEVTLTFPTPVTLGTTAETATPFWLVVPPTTFESGITITVNTSDGGVFEKRTTGSLAISRNTRSKMAALEVVPVPQVRYLTFNSEGTTTLSLNKRDITPVLYYSFDKTNWTLWDYSQLSFTSDHPLYLCGDNPDGIGSRPDSGTIYYCTFVAGGSNFSVSGDIMSLIDKENDVTIIPSSYCFYRLFSYCNGLTSAPDLPATTLAPCCYYGMFAECTSLMTAPELPAPVLAERCYGNMFLDCTSLTTAPELPATTLAEWCYSSMFSGCTSLTNVPELPATTLAERCYSGMFNDCTSLTHTPDLPATTLAEGCYSSMFSGCTSLTNAPELPATTLAEGCYKYLFRGCASLTKAPALPATTLAPYSYSLMFTGCTGLATAPALPATSLAEGCYEYMFYACTSLTTAPELPATMLTGKCYLYMFSGCSQLNYVKCLATDISADNCTKLWLSGVAATGTFVRMAGMNGWTRGENGIPEGWMVQYPEPEAVDLGLPSGLKWASYNVGASKPEAYGNHYAWGETATKADLSWSTYKWGDSSTTLTKYCTNSSYGTVDNITELQRQENEGETMDDVAMAKLGENWRMPTNAEFHELLDNTDNAWTTYNGVNGWKFTNKTNANNWIFLPAAGYRGGTYFYSLGSNGCYYASSLNPNAPDCAFSLSFDSSSILTGSGYRCRGLSVRAVYAGTAPVRKDTTYLARWWFDASQVEVLSEHFTEMAKVDGMVNPDACLPGNGGLYVEPNVSGSGRIEFYNGVDKTAINPNGRVKRTIALYGDVTSYGTWKGDYYLLTANTDAALPAGTDIYIFFALRPNSDNVPKYWLVEIRDGDTWKPYLKTRKVTVEGEGEVTYNLELVYEAAGDPVRAHNSIVDGEYKLTAATKDIQIRILAVSSAYAEGEGLPSIIGDGPVQTKNPVTFLVGNRLTDVGLPVKHHTMICVVK